MIDNRIHSVQNLTSESTGRNFFDNIRDRAASPGHCFALPTSPPFPSNPQTALLLPTGHFEPPLPPLDATCSNLPFTFSPGAPIAPSSTVHRTTALGAGEDSDCSLATAVVAQLILPPPILGSRAEEVREIATVHPFSAGHLFHCPNGGDSLQGKLVGAFQPALSFHLHHPDKASAFAAEEEGT